MGVSLAPGFDPDPATQRDILDRIDDATESRCACGCGTHLDPAGASMWFANPDCQWRYQQQHADNPGDVYSRPDAAEAWAGADEFLVPLREPQGDMAAELLRRHARRRREAPPEVRATGGFVTPGQLYQVGEAGCLLPSMPSPRFEMSPNTRVWMNGQEITDQISSVTVERDAGSPTRIGFNGEAPIARDNVRVEVEQGGSTYVIDETHGREVPLPRLSPGPPRSPLDSGRRAEDYWTYEPLSSIQARIPAAPSPEEVMDNVYRASRWIQDQTDIRLEPWQEELLRRTYIGPISMEFLHEPMRFDEDVQRFRVSMQVMAQQFTAGMQQVGNTFRLLAEGFADAVRPALTLADKLRDQRRIRMKRLHLDYSRRRKARQRRAR